MLDDVTLDLRCINCSKAKKMLEKIEKLISASYECSLYAQITVKLQTETTSDLLSR